MSNKLNCVLLVDDNDSDNFLHKRVLLKAGIADHIEIAMNGKEAFEFLIKNQNGREPENAVSYPELVLLDINMPVMDGWELLEEYQKAGEIKNQKTVFIILTTSLNPTDKSRAERMLGSACFHFKPLTLEMINEIMQKHFP